MPNDVQKIIIAAGAFRSGSTWLFNAIRFALIEGKKDCYSCWVDDFDAEKANKTDYVLIKIHQPSEEWRKKAWRIFTIHRDLRDVARSAIDFLSIKNTDDVLQCVGVAARDHAFWKQHCDRDYRYDQIAGFSSQIIRDIASSLDLALNNSQVLRINSQLSGMKEPTETDRYDPVTLLHPTHKFGGQNSSWSNRLSDDQTALIMNEFAAWMEDRGYK